MSSPFPASSHAAEKFLAAKKGQTPVHKHFLSLYLWDRLGPGSWDSAVVATVLEPGKISLVTKYKETTEG